MAQAKKTAVSTTKSLVAKENPTAYKGSLLDQLEAVDKDLKDLHENVVLPMRKKRAELKKLRADLKSKVRTERSAEAAKLKAVPKPGKKSEKKAAKAAKIAVLSEPSQAEKDWAARRNASGNGRRTAGVVTKANS